MSLKKHSRVLIGILMVIMLMASTLLFAVADEESGSEDCHHENTTVSTVEMTEFSSWHDNQDGTHTHKRDMAQIEKCDDCGASWRISGDWEYDEPQPHTFDENGFCIYCNANKEIETEHDWSNHDGICVNCGTYHDHMLTWEDGVCVVCGVECSHDSTYEKDVWDNAETFYRVNENDETTHIQGANILKQIICNECGKILSEEESEFIYDNATEQHHFDQGECRECHAPCPHEHTFTREGEVVEDINTLIEGNEQQHLHQVKVLFTVHCDDCSMDLDSYEGISETFCGTGSELVYHVFEDGICKDCGYECLHYLYGHNEFKRSFQDNGDGTHTLTITKYLVSECSICHAEIREIENVTEVVEDHYFKEEKVCDQCGAENTCQHPNKIEVDVVDYCFNIETGEFTDGPMFEPEMVDEHYHRYDGVRLVGWYCETCGYDELKPVGMVYGHLEEHWFEDDEGICWACGYNLNEATPTPEPTAEPTPEPIVEPATEAEPEVAAPVVAAVNVQAAATEEPGVEVEILTAEELQNEVAEILTETVLGVEAQIEVRTDDTGAKTVVIVPDVVTSAAEGDNTALTMTVPENIMATLVEQEVKEVKLQNGTGSTEITLNVEEISKALEAHTGAQLIVEIEDASPIQEQVLTTIQQTYEVVADAVTDVKIQIMDENGDLHNIGDRNVTIRMDVAFREGMKILYVDANGRTIETGAVWVPATANEPGYWTVPFLGNGKYIPVVEKK